ncbi:Transcriptional regulator, LysR family [Labilithrix luteola]|uniref:Transcriptional regulator, LysR family n=1 Tax=Labilithrix luteola TaxID=1391654 RepID=A0A0K1QES7_9BACT|nr:Transcriptional regulator, LysR family [Labilithrix luteola]
MFLKCSELSSFSAVAREMRLAQSQVSRAVRALEDDVGVPLFVRTTRSVTLTSEGKRYLVGVRAAFDALEAAKSEAKQSRDAPSGVLRVTAPPELAEVIGDVIGGLARRYPELAFDAVFTGRVVDLVREGFEVGIRAGALTLAPPEFRAYKLAASRSVVCAAPDYPAPRTPDELAAHPIAVVSRKTPSDLMLHHESGRKVRVALDKQGRLRVDDLRAIRSAALAGACLAILPETQLGGLVRVLPHWATAPTPIHALTTSTLPRVRVFIDALADRLGAKKPKRLA